MKPLTKLGIIALLMLIPGVASAQDKTTLTFTQASGEVNIPLVLVHVQVDGKPATLILDSGAQSVCLDSKLAKGMPVVGRSSNSGIGSAEATVVRATVEVGGNSYPVLALASDFAPLSKRLGIHVDGLLGEAVLSQYSKVTIDYAAKTVTLEK